MTISTHIGHAIVAVGLVAFIPGWVHAGGQATTAAKPTLNIDNGRQTYVKKGCYACHGREGQGSPTTGPRLGPNPLPLAGFTRYVRTPRGQMPPYTEKVLSDAELGDIHAFLESRPRPAQIEGLLPPT
jgi:ubiquinol-cytochrome c reductase cytochrome c subunit